MIDGGDGNDQIAGGQGTDMISGGAGDDQITGGQGNDMITGGAGNDIMDGGPDDGDDTFVFGSNFGDDVINNFQANSIGGNDLLDISALGITASTFEDSVVIEDYGSDIEVTVDGGDTILLVGVNDNEQNIITQADFLLG